MIDILSAHRHVAIVGPTAVGKSALALSIARQFGDVELVSIDSMQVYRGMDIGTAKPSVAEQGEVAHHLIDLIDAGQDFSLAEFQACAHSALADIERRGKRAVLVGGTGLYVQAVIDAMALPGQYPDARVELEVDDDTEGLHARLLTLDPSAAERMEPTNRRRILRALEVTIGSGRPFSSFGPGMNEFPHTPIRQIGLWVPRDVGGRRIDARVDDMLGRDWLGEVRHLKQAGPLSKTAAQALGYKELLSVLDGTMTEADAGIEIARRTRAFARRQRVWFRRDSRIHWFGTAADPGRLTDAVLRDCMEWFDSEPKS